MVSSHAQHIDADDPELLATLRQLDNDLAERPAVDAGRLIMRLQDARGYYVASALDTFDRELRRASAAEKHQRLSLEDVAVRGRKSDLKARRRDLYPDPPSAAALGLVAAEQGSSLLLLEPLGAAQDLLLSRPLSALLNAATLSGWAWGVTVWLRRQWPTNEGGAEGTVTSATEGVPEKGRGATPALEPPPVPRESLEDRGRSELTALRAAEGDPSRFLGEPDFEIELPSPELTMDGAVFRGPREINYVRREPDGTTTWVTIR
jgi:hypothetical protein